MIQVFTSVTVKVILFWDATPCLPCKFTNVSEECAAYNFMVEEKVKQERSKSCQVYLYFSRLSFIK
jgi:hypothetical protein